MNIVKLTEKNTVEFRQLINIFKDVFENTSKIPSDEYLTRLLLNPDFMVFVAMENNAVIGGLTLYVLHQYYDTKPLAYIYDVGITPAYQGKGIGKRLIAETCEYCKKAGFAEAYVEAELDDTSAVEFYRKTNHGATLSAIHFSYTFAAE